MADFWTKQNTAIFRQIPGGLKKEKTPQFVLLTFDNAVNGLNKDFFKDLFHKRLNSNICSVLFRRYISNTTYVQTPASYILSSGQ